MSGGHFDYAQYRLNDIAISIQELIDSNDSTKKDKYGFEIGRHYSEETIWKFKEAVMSLKLAQVMAQRIDWLVCDDDGEETFHERWKEDINRVKGGE